MRPRIDNLMRRFLCMRILSDDKGATSVEYAIIGSLIAAVIVLTVATLGTQVQELFQTVTGGW